MQPGQSGSFDGTDSITGSIGYRTADIRFDEAFRPALLVALTGRIGDVEGMGPGRLGQVLDRDAHSGLSLDEERWPRLFEQLNPGYKWIVCRW